jgi:hypothetical protein
MLLNFKYIRTGKKGTDLFSSTANQVQDAGHLRWSPEGNTHHFPRK